MAKRRSLAEKLRDTITDSLAERLKKQRANRGVGARASASAKPATKEKPKPKPAAVKKKKRKPQPINERSMSPITRSERRRAKRASE